MAITRNGSSVKDVAVYMDYENLYVSLKSTVKIDPDFDALMEKCREFGRVTVARAYADWSEFSKVVTSQMFANGIEPIFVPTRKFYDAKTKAEARKNSVDIHITIDIIKSLFLHENVDVFMIISGDRDYVPLINQIRQQGKEVYALGVAGCTSSELSVAVDEMFFYHQLLESGQGKEDSADVYNELVRAVRTARRRGYATTLGILKPIMRELVEGFNERKYKDSRGTPFQKFKDLVLEAERRRLVRVVTTGPAVEVLLWAEEAPAAAAPASSPSPAPARERGRERRPRSRPPAAQMTSTVTETTVVAPEPAPAAPPVAPLVHQSQELPQEVVAEDAEGAEREREPEREQQVATPEPDREGTPEPEGEAAPKPEREAAPKPERPKARQPEREPAPVAEEKAVEPPPAAPAALLDESTWQRVLHGLESFGDRPPSPRKLVGQLKKMRDDDGEFPGTSNSDLQELVQQSVSQGRLVKVSRGFATILRVNPDHGA